MKLRSKLLALLVVSSTFNAAYADGCGGGGGGGHGRFSFGGGGISFGPMHFQSSGHQFQQNYTQPCQRSIPSYESSPQVIYHDSNTGVRVYPQQVQSLPSGANSVPYAGPVPTTQSNHQTTMNQGQALQPQMQPSQVQSQLQGGPVHTPNAMQQPQIQQAQLQAGQSHPFPGQLVAASGNPGQAPNYPANGSQTNGMTAMHVQPQVQSGHSPAINVGQSNVPNRMQQSGGMPIVAGSQSSIPNGNASGLSALQILGSMSSPTGQSNDNIAVVATASQTIPNHLGSWIVSMNSNQMIKLTLNPNNTFVWSVIKDGNESRLEGQYRLDGQRLVMVRSSDLQQMAGTWTGNGASFTFKLDGATDSGLPFARAQ